MDPIYRDKDTGGIIYVGNWYIHTETMWSHAGNTTAAQDLRLLQSKNITHGMDSSISSDVWNFAMDNSQIGLTEYKK